MSEIENFSADEGPYLCPECKQPLNLEAHHRWLVEHYDWNSSSKQYEHGDDEGEGPSLKAACRNEKCSRYLFREGRDPEANYIGEDEAIIGWTKK